VPLTPLMASVTSGESGGERKERGRQFLAWGAEGPAWGAGTGPCATERARRVGATEGERRG
jgi:hypothetical protein